MPIKSFNEVKEEVRSLRHNSVAKAVQANSESKPKKEPSYLSFENYPQIGQVYRGAVYTAPYVNPALHASAIYRLPGRRRRWIDSVMKVWRKEMVVYNYLLKTIISGAAAGFAFLFLPMPYTYLGFVFALATAMFAMCWHNHRIACWEYEMNMGHITGVTYEAYYKEQHPADFPELKKEYKPLKRSLK